MTQERDELGHLTNTAYDNRNRATSTTEQTGPSTTIVTSATYDAANRKATAVNGRNKTTTYGYDERSNLTLVTYPDATTRQFHYDGNGNRNQRVDGRGRVTNYTYDDLDRLTQVYHVYDGTSFNYTYHYDGTRATMTDPSSVTAQTWTYNGAKQLTAHYQPVPNKTLTYTYDTGGRRKTTTLGSQIWTYNFDGAYRLQNLTQIVGAATPAAYTYNADSSVNTRTHGSGAVTTYAYDLRGRVSSVKHNLVTVVDALYYTYDDANNVLTYTSKEERPYPLPILTRWSSTYVYDWADRLTSETRSGSYGSLTTGYTYDGNGNRDTVTRAGVPSTYTVDNNDRLTSGDGYTLSGYDGDGNPGTVFNAASGVTMTLAWDTESKLTHIYYSSGGTDAFTYNGDGLRVQKVDNAGPVRHVYDGTTVVADVNAAGTILNYHVPGVGVVTGSTQGYFRENALGSSVSTTDAAGAVNSRTEYDAFGMEHVAMAGPRTNFRFAGKHGYYSDDRSGLDLLGQRYYVPKLGRFLNQDPIGHEAGFNLYAYCDNNPLKRVDPDGKDWDWAQYMHDVGQVLLGYGDVVNPVNIAKGFAGSMANAGAYSADYNQRSFLLAPIAPFLGAGRAGADGIVGTFNTLTNWSNPRAFGNSMATGLMLAAPGIKGIKNPTPYGLEAYPLNQGGFTLLNVAKNGSSQFRVDYHRLSGRGYIREKARGKVRLHYHRKVKGVKNSIDVHRPYQHVKKNQSRW